MNSSFTKGISILLFVLSFIYVDLAFFGIGIPVLLVVILMSASLLSSQFHTPHFLNNGRMLTASLLYLAYSLFFILALWLNHSLESEDVRFVASLGGQILWFPAVFFIMISNRHNLLTVMKGSVVISSLIMLFIWILSVALSGDVFTIRNGDSVFSSGDYLLVPSVFENANLTARAAFLLLVLSLYFSLVTLVRKERTLWIWLAVAISLLILSSLSRAVISGIVLLWLFYIFGSRRQRASKRLFILAILTVIFTMFLLNPLISERIAEALVRLSELKVGFGSTEISVRDMTIRGRTWAASIQIFLDNPIVGVGVSESMDVMRFYGAVHYKTGVEQPIWVHGGFLKIALYAGSFALLPFLLLYGYLIKTFFSSARSNPNRTSVYTPYAGWLGLGLMLALIAVNTGADSFGVSMTWFVIAFLLSEASIKRKSNAATVWHQHHRRSTRRARA